MLSILLAATIAAATPQAAPNAALTPAAKAAARDAEIVCWQETPAGSHIAVRQCARRDALERRTRQDQDMLERAWGQQKGGPGAGNFGEGAGTGH